MAQYTLTITTGFEDAYRIIRDFVTKTNTGGEGVLKVGGFTYPTPPEPPYFNFYYAYIKFPFSLPAGKRIVSAKLYLYAVNYEAVDDEDDISPGIWAYRVTSDWDENEVATSESEPSRHAYVGTGTQRSWAKSIKNEYIDISILPFVELWNSGTPNYGVCLEGDYQMSTGNIFNSFQAASNKPYVTIVYEDVPPSPPTNLAPSSTIVSRMDTIRFSWSSPATQTAFTFEWSSDGGSTWTTVNQSTANKYYDMPSYTLPIGTVHWRVKYKSNGENVSTFESLYSSATIITANVPAAPTGLTPVGVTIDRQIVNRFSWSSPATQTAFTFEWSSNGGSTWTTVNQSTANTYYDVPANTFPAGTILWRVKYFDSQPVVSTYSQAAIVAGQKPATPTITSSTTIAIARPIITWSATGQVAFEVRIILNEQTIYSSGEIMSSEGSFTVPFALINDSEYTFEIRVRDSTELWSLWAQHDVTIAFPIPPKPTFVLSEDEGVKIQITNPSPEATEDEFAMNDIYKKAPGGNWIRIATGLTANAAYTDYSVIQGATYEYKVSAIGAAGGYTDSDIDDITIAFRNPVLSLPDGTLLAEVKFNLNREERIKLDGTQMEFAGRHLQVTEFSEHISTELAIQFSINDVTKINTIRTLVKTKQILLYRDRYRAMYCTATSIVIKDRMRHKVWDVSLVLSETSYEEEV